MTALVTGVTVMDVTGPDITQVSGDRRPFSPRGGGTSRSRFRFFRHRRAVLCAALGDRLSDVAKITIERIVRAEWDLVQFDRRIDKGERLTGAELRARGVLEGRLRTDLAALERAPKPAPKPVAVEPKPEPAASEPEPAPEPASHGSALAAAIAAGRDRTDDGGDAPS
jgi:hypothetical protein